LRSVHLRITDGYSRGSLIRPFRNLAGLLLLLAAAACGGGGSSDGASSTTPPGTVAVAIAPTSASVVVATGTETFSATVTGSSNTGVTWQVNSVVGGNATVGTISTAGLYTAPATLPTPATVTVTAVADADSTKSASATVTLTQAGTATPPTVPTGLVASNVTTGTATLSWTASTDASGPGVGGYYVYRNGAQVASITSGTSYNDATLTGGSSYSYQVAAFDKATPADVSALSAALSVTSLADTVPPTVPTGLAASNIATGSVTLTWNASTDLPNPGATGVGGYYVYRNGTQIATVTVKKGTTYTDAALTASTAYTYQVAAYDKASTTSANVSALSASISATTLPDTVAPTVPAGLTASNVTNTTATINWNASTDLPIPGATGVGGYFVYRNGTQIANVTSGTSFSDSGLTTNSSYSYKVAAYDKASPPNVSAQSSALSFTAGNGLTITPRNAALTLQQTQQFSTNAPLGTILNWSVDGVAGGNGTVGTVSAGGLYTPPSTHGTHTVTATNSINLAYTASAAVAVTDLTGVTTWHNDNARTGQNLQEYALTPTTVASGFFGKRWSCPLDGTVYAQPLYMANVSIGGGTHNVLLVETMNDTIYAFDADNGSCTPYWQNSYISPSAGTGITTISSANATCTDVLVQYGITGTPVIDPNNQTIYFVTSTTENGTYFQRLHALNISTGAEQANSPVVIAATVPGDGDGTSTVTFNALYQNQRLGLTLTGGGIVIGWGSRCDNYLWPWYGWMMRYDETSLQQTAKYNVAPNGERGGIWMAGGAPALDTEGNMFLSTGNGTFDDTSSAVPALAPNNDFGESFLNLSPTTLTLQDFYTPSQNAAWTTDDLDISSGGMVVLPDNAGPPNHHNVVIGTDKQGHLWMMDRTNMSGFQPAADNTVQYLLMPNASEYSVHAAPAYWNGNGNPTIIASVANGPVMAFQLAGGLVPISGTTAPETAIASSSSSETYNYPNPTPAISAAASGAGAIVWVLDNNANGTDNGSTAMGPAILRAYDATNLATTLYSSDRLAADVCGTASKFTVPVVANGHVYVVGSGALTVYGMTP
jgi:chitodextrinase